jgi:hypothetical protein
MTPVRSDAHVGSHARDAVAILAGPVYVAYLGGSPSGQTVGKKLLGIKNHRLRHRRPIGFGRGALR